MMAAALAALSGCRERQHRRARRDRDRRKGAKDRRSGHRSAHPAQKVLMASVAQGLVRFDARGQIEPGLAERWNVSDDGLSYVFRLGAGNWPDGRSIQARDVARMLTRTLRSASRNRSQGHARRGRRSGGDDRPGDRDKTDCATPQSAAIARPAGNGADPRRAGHRPVPAGPAHRPERRDGLVAYPAGDRRSRQARSGRPGHCPRQAIAAFAQGDVDLVLGGTFDDLPLVRRARIARGSLRFDPVAGLFGLVPARKGGPLADKELRGLLNRAIDREALVAALDVPGLTPRATLLQGGLAGNWRAHSAALDRDPDCRTARRAGSGGAGTVRHRRADHDRHRPSRRSGRHHLVRPPGGRLGCDRDRHRSAPARACPPTSSWSTWSRRRLPLPGSCARSAAPCVRSARRRPTRRWTRLARHRSPTSAPPSLPKPTG